MDQTFAESEPWQQQRGEPGRWYARFEQFRMAGPSRSLLGRVNAERQQRGAGKSKSVPQSWASNARKWRWRERAKAWDDFQLQEDRAAYDHELKEMRRRHQQEARALQSKGIERLKSLNVEDLSGHDALRFCIQAAQLERIALGEAQTRDDPHSVGMTVTFTVEDAVRADQELEEWNHARMHPRGSPPLPDRDPQVP